jgi:hypothetical protein
MAWVEYRSRYPRPEQTFFRGEIDDFRRHGAAVSRYSTSAQANGTVAVATPP